MSLKQECDRCKRLAPVGRDLDRRKDFPEGYPEGYSEVTLWWNLSDFHRKGFLEGTDRTWEICRECTLQLREFFGIPLDGDEHTGPNTWEFTDTADYDITKVPLARGTQHTWERVPVDFFYKTAFNEVYDSLTFPAEPTYGEFQTDVIRRAAELRGAAQHTREPEDEMANERAAWGYEWGKDK